MNFNLRLILAGLLSVGMVAEDLDVLRLYERGKIDTVGMIGIAIGNVIMLMVIMYLYRSAKNA